MLTNFRPGTPTMGATYFIGKAMIMISDHAEASSDAPFGGEEPVKRVARFLLNMKIVHGKPQTLETQEEFDQLQDLLRVTHGLALACRFDPRWNGWDTLPNPLPGDPVTEIAKIIEDTKSSAITSPAAAA